MDDGCRVYVCKSMFGAHQDECFKFESMMEYQKWLSENQSVVHHYSFQPVCSEKELFDRFILSWRSGKCNVTKITKSSDSRMF